jgi:hypothetical protein
LGRRAGFLNRRGVEGGELQCCNVFAFRVTDTTAGLIYDMSKQGVVGLASAAVYTRESSRLPARAGYVSSRTTSMGFAWFHNRFLHMLLMKSIHFSYYSEPVSPISLLHRQHQP